MAVSAEGVARRSPKGHVASRQGGGTKPFPGVRASQAQAGIHTDCNAKQQAFLDFVLAQYIKVGVGELDQAKLSPLIKLKYNAIADAIADLGPAAEIGRLFTSFQKYLYQPSA